MATVGAITRSALLAHRCGPRLADKLRPSGGRVGAASMERADDAQLKRLTAVGEVSEKSLQALESSRGGDSRSSLPMPLELPRAGGGDSRSSLPSRTSLPLSVCESPRGPLVTLPGSPGGGGGASTCLSSRI
eukprot:6326764-Prymnesium_polylepis.1